MQSGSEVRRDWILETPTLDSELRPRDALGGGTLPRIGTGRRLLIVSPGIPHPAEGASTVLFFHYIEALKRSGFEILNLLLLLPDNSSEDRLADYVGRVAEPGKFEVLPCRSDRFLRMSMTGPALVSTAVDAVRPRVTEFRPDAIFALDILSAWAAMEFPARAKIVWLGDLNFQTFWYNTLYSWRERTASLAALPAVWLQCAIWERIYGKVLRRYDRVIVASKSSETALAPLGVAGIYLPYPWPAKEAPVSTGTAKSSVPMFLFLGTLTALGSRSAFHFLIRKVYPALVALWGARGFRIVICGRGDLPAWFSEAIADKPEFESRGFVEDLDPLMAQCHALLAPISVPVGNRSRILTAFAARLLVIAHQNAALGNPDLVDGETCYLAGDSAEMVERMRRAAERPDEAAEIVERAHAVYARNFAPDQASARLLRTIEPLLN